MTTRKPHARSGESGNVMVLVMIIMVLAMFVSIAFAVVNRGSENRARDDRDRVLGNAPIDEAVTAYTHALDTGLVGENTGWIFTDAMIQKYVTDQGGGACGAGGGAIGSLCYLPNSATGQSAVDTTHMSLGGTMRNSLTVRRTAAGGSFYFWQVFSIVPPRLGTTNGARLLAPGGRLVVYFRGWVASSNKLASNKPDLVRVELRAPVFSDFQLFADGKMLFGPTANITAAVHSNGYNQSLNNQYDSQPQAIQFTGTVCSSSARVTTTSGSVGGSASCTNPAVAKTNTNQLIDLLGVEDTLTRYRQLCTAGANTALRVTCLTLGSNVPKRWTVRLGAPSADSITVNPGGRVFSARNDLAATPTISSPPGSAKVGTVLVFDRSIEVTGKLGGTGRATLVASNPNAGDRGEPPAVYVTGNGTVGSSGGQSAVGFIADTDVVLQESRACNVTVRAAMIATGGLISMDPAWRGIPVRENPAPPCAPNAHIVGSATGHLAPYLYNNGTLSGYQTRTYDFDPALYDNPPPLFPVTGKWLMLSYRTANYDCFSTGTAPRIKDLDGCS